MNLFVALDSNYINPLCVMFNSLAKTNEGNSFDIYVAYSSLTEEDFAKMEKALGNLDARIHRVFVDDDIFSGAPVLNRLSKATYYRLLIGEILPADVDRLIYLDPDIVINGDLSQMYNLDLKGNVLAGATHLTGLEQWVNFHRLRVKRERRNCYINAGVLLIDLNLWRKNITLKQILDYIQKWHIYLLLADQDVINVLFADKLLKIDERRYNLDERSYRFATKDSAPEGKINLDWVRKNTLVIHYNGKNKPWGETKYKGSLGEFYEKYKNF